MVKIDMDVNIDLPNNCMECKFCFDEQYKNLGCLFTEEYVGMNYITRHPNCPLIECEENE